LLVPANGFTKSVLMRIRSLGRLSVIVIVPAPTLSLPSHVNTAPWPAGAPANATFALGSTFAQGDQSSHRCRSFTCGKIAAAGAPIVVERVRR
jgi:hypothetical protein